MRSPSPPIHKHTRFLSLTPFSFTLTWGSPEVQGTDGVTLHVLLGRTEAGTLLAPRPAAQGSGRGSCPSTRETLQPLSTRTATQRSTASRKQVCRVGMCQPALHSPRPEEGAADTISQATAPCTIMHLTSPWANLGISFLKDTHPRVLPGFPGCSKGH